MAGFLVGRRQPWGRADAVEVVNKDAVEFVDK
jgi:hypothetical protein